MHICFLCHEYPPGPHGGVGSFTQTLARALVNRGHGATVVGVCPPERAGIEEDQGVAVVRLPRSRIPRTGFVVNGWRVRRALRRIHRDTPIDLIEGPELSLAVLSRSFSAAKVIRMNGGHHFFAVTLGKRPAPWRSWQERRSFRTADHVCAVSRFVAETTRQLLELGNRPIEILPNPVDTSVFRSRPEIPEEAGLIVFVGTVCEKKGIRQLIQAMPAIAQAAPEAHLLVVGRDWRDRESGRSFTEYLRGLIPADLQERIVFQGAVEHDRLWQLLARAAVCVYPSHMEALPVAWLEAMAMGKAVVASNTGPGPEVIEDGVSGLLCNPHHPEAIAEKVIQLLKAPELRRRLGAAARQRAVEHFPVDVLVGRNLDFYRRCAECWKRDGAAR